MDAHDENKNDISKTVDQEPLRFGEALRIVVRIW